MAAAAVVFVVFLLVAFPLNAQTGATLQGQVCDASGAILPGATVSVRNRLGGFDRSVVADDAGRYIKITRTRLPTGEAGSSRQIQLSFQLSF